MLEIVFCVQRSKLEGMGRSHGWTCFISFSLVVPSVLACSRASFCFVSRHFWPKKEKRQKKSSCRGEVNWHRSCLASFDFESCYATNKHIHKARPRDLGVPPMAHEIVRAWKLPNKPTSLSAAKHTFPPLGETQRSGNTRKPSPTKYAHSDLQLANLLALLLSFYLLCFLLACPFMSIPLLFSWPISDGQCWRPSWSLAYLSFSCFFLVLSLFVLGLFLFPSAPLSCTA